MDYVLLVLSVILTCIFRTNGIIAVLLLLIVMFIFLKEKRKQIALCIGIPLIMSFILVGPVYSACGIRKTETTESIGIFIRQIYGTIYDGGEIDAESEEYLSHLVNKDDALEKYTPFDDHIQAAKSYDNDYLEGTKKEFIMTYFRIGIHNIRSYIRLYLKATYGVWYPDATGYIVQRWPITTNDYGLSSKNNFENLKILKLFSMAYNAPIIKWFMSEAFYIWIYLIVMCLLIVNKKYKYILSILLPLFVWMTIMIATPLSYQPRYMFIMHCSFPIIVLCAVETYNTKEDNKKVKKAKKNEKA